ncbi:unnamed protein product [Closterium sp. NIES-54]
MEIARTSMIHTRVSHFLWPYAVRYATHQLNLWRCVSRPGASQTSLWTGSPCVVPEFRAWGCLALLRNTSADKLSARAIPCVFLGFPLDSSDYTFYHPPLYRFFDSRDVWFDESVSYYTRYPCQGLPVPPPPLFLALFPPLAPAPPVHPPPPGLALFLDLSHATPLPSVARKVPSPSALPRHVAVDSGGVGFGGMGTGCASSEGTGAKGTDAGGASSEGAETEGVGAGGARCEGAGAEGTSAGGARREGARAEDTDVGGASHGGDWSWRRCCCGVYPTSPPQPDEFPEASSVGARGVGAVRAGEAGAGAAAVGAAAAGEGAAPAPATAAAAAAVVAAAAAAATTTTTVAAAAAAAVTAFAAVASTCDWPSGPWSSFPSSRPFTISSCLRSYVSRSGLYHVTRPVVTRVLASLFMDPRASPSSVLALTTTVTDFATTRRLDYTTRVVPARPLSVEVEFALGCDVLEDRQFELEFLAAASPHLCAMLLAPEGDPDALDIPTPCTYREAVSGQWASQWITAMDLEMASWRSTGTYVNAVPLPGANVVDGMWLFKVKRSPGSPPVFKVRYVARGFSQREGVDFFQNFAPTPKMTTLQVLLHLAAQRDYKLHSLYFSTAFLQSSLHEEIWLCRPPGFIGTFLPGTQWSLKRDRAALAEVKSELQKRHTCTDLGELRRYLGLHITNDRAARTITLTQSHMVWQVLKRVLSCFVATGRHCPVHWTATMKVAKYLATTSGMWLVLGGTQPVVLTGQCESSYADDVGTGAVSWRSTRSSSMASSSAEAEIYAGAMAAQDLCWLTFLRTDLGEHPISAQTLFVDNKAMILLCQEPRLESRVKHIDVRYFLLRDLQRRGQARLDFVASEANTTDIFTKALPPGDHHRFCLQLGLIDACPRLL